MLHHVTRHGKNLNKFSKGRRNQRMSITDPGRDRRTKEFEQMASAFVSLAEIDKLLKDIPVKDDGMFDIESFIEKAM